jgi:hypothetical protein
MHKTVERLELNCLTNGVQAATMALLRDGVVVLENIISTTKIDDVYRQLCEFYFSYFDEIFLDRSDDSLKVGNKRYFFNPKLTGAFADRDIFANQYVLDVSRHALGHDAILESFGIIISLPGSEVQHIHRDRGPLYSGGLANLLPPFALTVVIPLVEMNDVFGATAFWPGSHLREEKQEDISKCVSAFIPVGSCGIWDYRVYHMGLSNTSEIARPLLYMTYAKSWFRDTRNFKLKNQRRISFADGFLENLLEEDKPLFAHLRCLDSGLVD